MTLGPASSEGQDTLYKGHTLTVTHSHPQAAPSWARHPSHTHALSSFGVRAPAAGTQRHPYPWPSHPFAELCPVLGSTLGAHTCSSAVTPLPAVKA